MRGVQTWALRPVHEDERPARAQASSWVPGFLVWLFAALGFMGVGASLALLLCRYLGRIELPPWFFLQVWGNSSVFFCLALVMHATLRRSLWLQRVAMTLQLVASAVVLLASMYAFKAFQP
jgi:hypothetical protein